MSDQESATIVLVEDELPLQGAMEEILTQEGFTVVTADDGEAGYNAIKEHKPDLVLLDLMLPKMDGFDVLQMIKADSALQPIPVIVLTNLEGMGEIEKAMSLGATTYLVKANYELEDIIEKVRSVLSRSNENSSVV